MFYDLSRSALLMFDCRILWHLRYQTEQAVQILEEDAIISKYFGALCLSP